MPRRTSVVASEGGGIYRRADLAKWQTADPLGYPDGWNPFAYCGNRVTDAVDLLGCETVHNVSFGWYWDWGGIDGNSHSVAVNPFAAISADLPSVANVVSPDLWKLIAGEIAGYIRGELSDLTPFWDIFKTVESIDLDSLAKNIAEDKAAQWFDNIISIEVTDCEVLKIVDMKMDVVKNGYGDVLYLDIQFVKVSCLVHMKVVTE